MAVVFIPSLLQELTGGLTQVTIPGQNVRQVIDAMEQRFPGIRDRLCENDRLRPSMVLVVNGEVSRRGLRHALEQESEIHFLPAISGGFLLSI